MRNPAKILILFTCFLAFSLNTIANDTIRMIKRAAGGHTIGISATLGKQFTIDWGDGTPVETFTGTGTVEYLWRIFEAGRYEVTIAASSEDCLFTSFVCVKTDTLDLSSCPSIEYLDCHMAILQSLNVKNCRNLKELYAGLNRLTCLDLSDNIALQFIACGENMLPLSELYKISELISDPYCKVLGGQRFPNQKIFIGDPVDFSDQKEFGGIATVFWVTQSGDLAPQSDYTIEGGVITFHRTGNYSVSMGNAAIVSNPSTPAYVVTSFTVIDLPVIEIINTPTIKVYPNPTTGILKIENGDLIIHKIEVLDIGGRVVAARPFNILSAQHIMDISHLKAGAYFVKIITKEGEVVRKVVKQ